MTTLTPATPAPRAHQPFDRDYWLSHCEGFRVDTAHGRLGFVEEVRGGDIGDAVLAVRTGVLGRRVMLVPADAVDFIVPRAQRLWIDSPSSVGTEPRGHRE